MADSLVLKIDGMDCPSCASKVEGAVCSLPGVENATLNYTSQKLKLEFPNASELEPKVTRAIEKLGYRIVSQDAPRPAPQTWWQTRKGQLVIASGTLLAIATVLSFALPEYASYVFTAAGLLALIPLAKKAVMSALAGHPFTIETLVTIAVIGAIFIDESAEAAIVVFLFLIGELLEMIAAMKARRSVEALADLVPKTALLIIDGSVREVPATALEIGDIVEVRPGGYVPADGEIVEGASSFNEASITGESIPKNKNSGDNVYAGSVNADGLVRVQTTATADNNIIARILRMVEEAEASKSPTARFIDKFSTYYTPGVIVVAALIAFVPPLAVGADLSTWIYKGLAILLIGCPCALVLSTPAAVTSGISAGARQGLLIKGGAVLEAIGKVTRVAFDKTGTLTQGTPQVTDVQAFGGDEQEVLRLAAAVEAGSSHPLALAIVEKAAGLTIPDASDSKALQGRGVQAIIESKTITVASPRYAESLAEISDANMQTIHSLEASGKTVTVVLRDTEALGLIAIRDELREDAKRATARLVEMGVMPIMLTGDNALTGKALADQLGIKVKAEMMPEDKLNYITKLASEGTVAMVGDGINDAPALARADVGIAMGGGTDVAIETADAVLLQEKVSDVPALIDLSRVTMKNIYQNITIALGLKAVFLVTTLFGITTLWMAIFADTGATVLVTINALRLLRYKPKS
ncbi:MAG: heavy metal translocating P-type ATPase [Rhodobacteraceae bacterium]|nr:MAG: heavy metal translocating P-type ATPase [Paracoccaceae bacterium]